MLAHSDVRVTEQRYGHLSDDSQRRGFDTVGQLIEQAKANGNGASDALPAGK